MGIPGLKPVLAEEIVLESMFARASVDGAEIIALYVNYSSRLSD